MKPDVLDPGSARSSVPIYRLSGPSARASSSRLIWVCNDAIALDAGEAARPAGSRRARDNYLDALRTATPPGLVVGLEGAARWVAGRG
jgi:hypothetical protein